MTGFRWLLMFSLLSGIFAQQCDLGDFTIDDFSNHVVVTNASQDQDAEVTIAFDHADAHVYLRAGATRTFQTVATTEYRITVGVPDSPSGVSYGDSLRDLRDLLQDLSLDAGARPDAVVEVLTQLAVVQSTVQQLNGDGNAQSCGHKIGDGVDSVATVTWTGMAGGTGIWVLDCS